MKYPNKIGINIKFSVTILIFVNQILIAQPTNRIPIEELSQRPSLDDYQSNVLLGYQVVTETSVYGSRYAGNKLNCSHCHLNAGTKADGIPLNIEGMYPKWRSKNRIKNGIERRIRECFLYSLDGIMPPENAPEVLAVAAYIHYLSEGQIIGSPPQGRGLPSLPRPDHDANPTQGKLVFQGKCQTCHGEEGQGQGPYPPLWGPHSYNAGAGMHQLDKAAGFIWANMPLGQDQSLSYQEAWDVAAYIHQQIRPIDPRQGRIKLILDGMILKLSQWISNLRGS